MRITVLMGGASDERAVSLASGAQVAEALRARGHEVVCWDTAGGEIDREREAGLRDAGVAPSPPPPGLRDQLASGGLRELAEHPRAGGADVHFLALHGGAGEDGTLQALMDAEGMAYTGSDRIGCLLAMDKDLSKRMMRDAGIPTPAWMMNPESADAAEAEVGLPAVVKAASGGSSLRLHLAHDRAELEAALDDARHFGDHVLVEAYVRGREFTVGVLGGETLPIGEIIPAHELFDYECKYQPGMAQEIFPANLEEGIARPMREFALATHRTLRLRHYSRVDFMLDAEGGLWCLEANSLPGMTSNSLLPGAARAAGIDFPELCHRIATAAVQER